MQPSSRHHRKRTCRCWAELYLWPHWYYGVFCFIRTSFVSVCGLETVAGERKGLWRKQLHQSKHQFRHIYQENREYTLKPTSLFGYVLANTINLPPRSISRGDQIPCWSPVGTEAESVISLLHSSPFEEGKISVFPVLWGWGRGTE